MFCIFDMILGLASLRMDLSDEPTLGQWKIIANIDGNRQEQTFVIDEYGKICHQKSRNLLNSKDFLLNSKLNNNFIVILV